MADSLIYIIVLAAFFQPSRNRLYPALIFAFLTLSHLVIAGEMEGFVYFFTAVLTDLLIISLIVQSDSTLTLHLIVISITSILLNTIGWLLWNFYFPPFLYNTAFVALYIFAIIKLLHGGGDVGNITNDRLTIGFLGRTFQSNWHIHRVGKK